MTPSGVDAGPDAFDRFLERVGVTRRSLVARVDEIVGLRRGDVLLAVGSTAEGLGNRKSDVDLLLLGAPSDHDPHPDLEQGWMVGRCMVDLRVVPLATAQELVERLHRWAALPWNLMELAGFNPDERLLLHRLGHGVTLGSRDDVDASAGYRPPIDELARLKLQAARHLARTIQVDLVGYEDERDDMSLVFAAQELLGHAVDGLLAAQRRTNPNPKWRSRLLGTLPGDLGHPFGIRWAGRSARQVFWDLHRAPAGPSHDAALRHARRCAAFARAVFAWCEATLGTSTAPVQLPPADAIGMPRSGALLPDLELDVDFVLSGERIAIGRLNELGGSLEVSAPELAVVLCCDGSTTVPEIETALTGFAGGSAPGTGPEVVAGIVERMAACGLCRTAQVTGAHHG